MGRELNRTISNKIPLRHFQAFLRKNSFATARDFVHAFEKIEHAIGQGEIDSESFETATFNYTKHYLLFGKKVLYSVKFTSQEIDEVIATLEENQRYIDSFEQTDNLLLWDTEVLNSQTYENPNLLTSLHLEDEQIHCLFYGVKRKINKQIEIDKSNLGTEYRVYQNIYGIKVETFQAYDCIIVDKNNNTIDFLIENSLKLSQKLHHNFFVNLRSNFISMLGLDFNMFQIKENFFGAIDQYYHSENGIIKELGFKTDTGSIKVETMRDEKDDLRQERFHEAGVNAVSQITPFSIDITFENPENGNFVRQRLPGHFRNLDKAHPILNFYEFFDVLDVSDYMFLKTKVYETREVNV